MTTANLWKASLSALSSGRPPVSPSLLRASLMSTSDPTYPATLSKWIINRITAWPPLIPVTFNMTPTCQLQDQHVCFQTYINWNKGNVCPRIKTYPLPTPPYLQHGMNQIIKKLFTRYTYYLPQILHNLEHNTQVVVRAYEHSYGSLNHISAIPGIQRNMHPFLQNYFSRYFFPCNTELNFQVSSLIALQLNVAQQLVCASQMVKKNLYVN